MRLATQFRLALWALLLTGVATACTVPSPTLESEQSPSPAVGGGDFECQGEPEFEGQELHTIRLHDANRLVTGCRRVGFEERVAMGETVELMTGQDGMAADDTIAVAPAPQDSTELLLLWAVMGCDDQAQVEVSAAPQLLHVRVTQFRRGPCAPGVGPVMLALQLTQPVAADMVVATLQRAER